MSSLTSLLPQPKHSSSQDSLSTSHHTRNTTTLSTTTPHHSISPNNPSTSLVPTSSSSSTVAQLALDKNGNVRYDSLVPASYNKNALIQSTYQDLAPKQVSETALMRPSPEEELANIERTKKALSGVVESKMLAKSTVHQPLVKHDEPVFIRYTPTQQSSIPTQQRIIRLQQKAIDPLEPPRFKHTKLPAAANPDSIVPVMHSPPRKVTVEEHQQWKIPSVISQWKNNKGYTIPLDKRMAADGRGLQQPGINDRFASLSEALFIAERSAREEVEQKAMLLKKLQKKQKEDKEEELRAMAAEARAAVQSTASFTEQPVSTTNVRESSSGGVEESEAARLAREELRRETARELKRDMRVGNKAKEKEIQRGKIESSRDTERDVSEKIALGQALPTSNALFDQRLFNQGGGIGRGFNGEDSYDIYDKPLFSGKNSNNYIYRAQDQDAEEEEENPEQTTTDKESRAVKDILERSSGSSRRGFAGADSHSSTGGGRTKPVEFEREEADPFGIGELLNQASSTNSERRTGGALERIGQGGSMGLSGGGSGVGGRSREEWDREEGERRVSGRGFRTMEFVEAASATTTASGNNNDSSTSSGGRGQRTARSRSRSSSRERDANKRRRH